jgi:hypothetical protein
MNEQTRFTSAAPVPTTIAAGASAPPRGPGGHTDRCGDAARLPSEATDSGRPALHLRVTLAGRGNPTPDASALSTGPAGGPVRDALLRSVSILRRDPRIRASLSLRGFVAGGRPPSKPRGGRQGLRPVALAFG